MSLGEGEFHFWTESRPPLRHRWTGPWKAVEDDDYSSSPLLPHDHCCSSPPPSWRSRVIEQGRRELMEMVRDRSESSFELSLKDIVDELQSSKESPKEDGSIREGVDRKQDKEEEQKRIKKRKKANPAGFRKDQRQVSRTSSMDSGTFMIKMFFPAFLTSRKALPRGGKGSKSKVSPRSSIDGPENREDSGSWSRKSIAAADQRIHKKHSNSSSSSSSSSSRSRSSSCRDCMVVESSPSCWPFGMVKGKMRRQRTCNF